MVLSPLPDIMWEPIVRAGLLEDLGVGGDATSQAVARPGQRLRAVFRARRHGVVAGMSAARLSFTLLEPSAQFETVRGDGEIVAPGEILAVVEAGAETVLGARRHKERDDYL